MDELERQLAGSWRQVDPDPHPASIVVTFEADGRLLYTIETATIQHVLLTWRIEEGLLVTRQPSAAADDRTPFRFAGASRLVLDRPGESFSYERVETERPAAPEAGRPPY